MSDQADELAEVDLANLIQQTDLEGPDGFAGVHVLARAILAAGWRRSTVTPEQVAAAETVFGSEYHDLIVGVAHQFGLSVAEDGAV
jgi:hypothetical protein